MAKKMAKTPASDINLSHEIPLIINHFPCVIYLQPKQKQVTKVMILLQSPFYEDFLFIEEFLNSISPIMANKSFCIIVPF